MAFSTAAASLPLPTKLSVLCPSSALVTNRSRHQGGVGGRRVAVQGGGGGGGGASAVVMRSASADKASTDEFSTSAAYASSSEVYVAAIPLVGLEAVGAVLGERYPGRLEHTMVLVRHKRSDGGGAVTAYDFLPLDPMNPVTAATLLSGGSVLGELRVRTLRGLPSRRCWKVGDTIPGLGLGLDGELEGKKKSTAGGAAVRVYRRGEAEGSVSDDDDDDDDDDGAGRRGVDAAALRFQRQYDARLTLAGGNSCREHTSSLAAFLTGVEYDDVAAPENTM